MTAIATAGPPVFLVDPGGLTARSVTLSAAEARHAAAVRRLRVGERADVSDGAGMLASCVVASVGKDTVGLTVQSVAEVPPAQPRITVRSEERRVGEECRSR